MEGQATVGDAPPAGRALGSVSRAARWGYLGLAWVFVVCVLVQVFLAGMLVFVSRDWQEVHVQTGHIFGLLPYLMLILALVGRMPRKTVLLTLLLALLYGLQYAFINGASGLGVAAIAAFHPVNALLIFWTAITLARRAPALASPGR
jgi:hypothetical protein